MGYICGILGKKDRDTVRAMAQAMAHRGGKPRYLEEDAAVVASHTAASSVYAALDGRPRDSEGHPLDHEALANYVEGLAKPEQCGLRGAFSVAVRQEKSNAWWLIRDRLGIKPLYYYAAGDCLLFASELKALLATGLVPRHLNLPGVDQYLTFRCVPGPGTVLQDVYRVPPSAILAWDGQDAHVTEYGEPRVSPRGMTRERAAEKLRGLLSDAVHGAETKQMLWAAGVDSAALGALGEDMAGVFVSLDRTWQDEENPARESAQRLGVPLTVLQARRFSEHAFNRAVHHLDEPIGDASVLPQWLLFEAASEAGGELVSGHGADVLLGGYPRYHYLQKARGARAIVPANLLASIAPSLPPNAFIRRASRYLTSLHDPIEGYLSLISVFDHDERGDLYTEAMSAALHDHGPGELLQLHFEGQDLPTDLLRLDLRVGLPSLLLPQCDRLAAAHGLELRMPFLDDAVVDFAASLPPDIKFGMRSKSLLRLALRSYVPARIRLRGRKTFRIPQDGRVAGMIESIARGTITRERVEATGLFRWPYIEQVLRSAGHNIYRRRQFWALLMFFAWYRDTMEQ